MSGLAAILVSSAQHAAALMSRAGIDGSTLNFSDGEPLQALAAVTQHHPPLIVLERFFAATPRGAALINRIKADPSLATTEIKVIAHDSGYTRVIPRGQLEKATPVAEPAAEDAVAPVSAEPPAAEAPEPLDTDGTRIAPRLQLQPGTQLQLGGAPVTLVDLSRSGAQVLSAHALRPNDRFEAVLANDEERFQFEAQVVWANFEAPGGQAQYRAGLTFQGADPESIDKFSAAHKA